MIENFSFKVPSTLILLLAVFSCTACNLTVIKLAYIGPSDKSLDDFVFISLCNNNDKSADSFTYTLQVDNTNYFLDKAAKEIRSQLQLESGETKYPNNYTFRAEINGKKYVGSLEDGTKVSEKLLALLESKRKKSLFYSFFVEKLYQQPL